MDVTQGVLAGDTRAIARAITWVENGDSRGAELIRCVYGSTGRAYIVGLTGSPGAGKSTLVARLAGLLAAKGHKVGILAVDPSSPFSGGAILGDRVRMFDVALARNVYIRSMGTRGATGGLNRTTRLAVRILDAAGFDWILVETVGAGQSEVDVHDVAYTTVVVMAPGMGDDIQAMKAGIMEIGDLFVINKADREGADRAATQIESILQLSMATGWHPPVLKVSAEQNTGVDRVIEAIEQHRSYLVQSGQLDVLKVRMAKLDVLEILKARLVDMTKTQLDRPAVQAELNKVVNRQSDPYTLADSIFEQSWRKT
ncbi:MAG: methylmalonyl Co-A mutase-associated GTPase MeaB [Candidatus Cryosericum sp.]|nr:methylmalonyl Co-A mutase-associated GTPase MeaB [bacterium]